MFKTEDLSKDSRPTNQRKFRSHD